MALKGALIWLCSLAALSLSTDKTTHETVPDNCSSQTRLFGDLSAHLRAVLECGDNLLSSWSEEQRAALLLSLNNLTDSLHKHQPKEPNKCPEAKAPDNGGLACVTVDNKRYCKPMCNYGYDFGFLRISRLFEECSEQTQYKWSTQYIGGNTLAVCNEQSVQVSGAKSAYFPNNQDCQTTKSNAQLESNIIDVFTTELKNQNIQGQAQFPSLVCGKT